MCGSVVGITRQHCSTALHIEPENPKQNRARRGRYPKPGMLGFRQGDGNSRPAAKIFVTKKKENCILGGFKKIMRKLHVLESKGGG